MSFAPRPAPRAPLIYRLPVLGRMIRETLDGEADTPFYALASVISLWAIAMLKYGYAGLITGALIMTGVMMLVLIRLTRG